MNIILFGPPGAGKGTQAGFLVNEFNLFKVSTGDILRNNINKKTSLGFQIKSQLDKGSFASDDIVNNLIEKFVLNNDYNNKIIFDGYPRNLKQAEYLDILFKKHKHKIACVLSIAITQDVAIKRIFGREVCSKCGLTFNKYFNPSTKENHKCEANFLSKRSDDNLDIAKSRFKTYTNETLPIIDHYKNQNLLYEIDGMREINKIYEEIRRIIRSLEA